jgi:hypothetical protein
MLHKVIAGYTIIAQEHSPARAMYLVMGVRRNHDGTFTYVTGWQANLDHGYWFWGNYGGTDFKDTIAGATDNFVSRLEG